ncbi:hypothetical protein AVEN_137539-1 [Araneus ventricosus]|uniref:Uncharacterized protein n=1 Tax=Araneus ventricosus TaxID=182803 RepID=A0A4Y2FLU3_ARAVE|nr:hypothetical protein AVEN_137539-1 [Araneus ventricosus]
MRQTSLKVFVVRRISLETCSLCEIDQLAKRTSWTNSQNEQVGQTRKANKLDKLAKRTSWTNSQSEQVGQTRKASKLDKLAKRTSLQRDSSNSEDVQRRLSHLSDSQVFIPFLTGYDDTENPLVNSVYLCC